MAYVGVGLRVKGSQEAVSLYCEALGLELGYHMLNEDGTFFHSELNKHGDEVLSVVESSETAAGYNPVQLGFQFDSEDELRKAFDLLKEGGAVTMEIGPLPWSPCSAEVTDRFGVNWYLSLPQHRPPEDFTPSDM